MPTTENRNLTLTKAGANVKLTVTYKAVFSVFERRLAGLGLIFLEQIAVIGVDPPGSTTGRVLDVFRDIQPVPVTDGNTALKVDRKHEHIMSKAALDEDPDIILLDEDEIRCRIRILALSLPPAVTPDVFTNEEVVDRLVQHL